MERLYLEEGKSKTNLISVAFRLGAQLSDRFKKKKLPIEPSRWGFCNAQCIESVCRVYRLVLSNNL